MVGWDFCNIFILPRLCFIFSTQDRSSSDEEMHDADDNDDEEDNEGDDDDEPGEDEDDNEEEEEEEEEDEEEEEEEEEEPEEEQASSISSTSKAKTPKIRKVGLMEIVLIHSNIHREVSNLLLFSLFVVDRIWGVLQQR